MPDDPSPAPALSVTAAVSLPDVATPLRFTNYELARLAREIAININEPATILAHFKITAAEFEDIKKNKFFAQVLEQETLTWNSALNAPERIKIEAAAMFEDFMPVLGARLMNVGEALNHVTEAGKLIARVAGVGETKLGEHAPGEKFTITINLGADDKLRFEKDANPSPPQITVDRSAEKEETSGGTAALPED